MFAETEQYIDSYEELAITYINGNIAISKISWRKLNDQQKAEFVLYLLEYYSIEFLDKFMRTMTRV